MTFIKNLLLLACMFLGTKQYAGSKTALRRRLKLEELEPRVVLSADDIIGGANWIGPISQVRTWAGESISPASDVDLYTIYLPAGQRIAIDLDRPSGNLDSFFRLFGSNGVELARNDDGPTPGEAGSLESYLEFTAPSSGNYFVGVSSYGNSNYNPITGANLVNGYSTGPYTLNVIPLSNSAVPPDYAGNTMAAARDLGAFTGSRSFQDFVGAADRDDYYRIVLNTRSDFNLALSGLSTDADVQLFNGSGGVIAGSYFGGNSSESISRTLDAGVYFVRVYQYSGDTNYNLTLTVNPAAPPDYAGNSMAAARDVGTLSGSRTYQDFVGAADRDDYYRFTLGTRSDFSLALTGLSADADVELLNSSGTVLARSTNGGSTPESIIRNQAATLDAGVYYIHVYQYAGDTNYNLSMISQPDFSLRAYRQDNPLWNAGFAPISTNPPNPQLGSALGNCTWYANGRLRELGYSSADLNRLIGNAGTWANTAQAYGIPVGTVPVVGAIAQSSTHVAVVERVNPDGTILISESSYYVDPVNHTGDFLWHLRTVAASSFQNYIYVRR